MASWTRGDGDGMEIQTLGPSLEFLESKRRTFTSLHHFSFSLNLTNKKTKSHRDKLVDEIQLICFMPKDQHGWKTERDGISVHALLNQAIGIRYIPGFQEAISEGRQVLH